jgi:hypothetical protein
VGYVGYEKFAPRAGRIDPLAALWGLCGLWQRYHSRRIQMPSSSGGPDQL